MELVTGHFTVLSSELNVATYFRTYFCTYFFFVTLNYEVPYKCLLKKIIIIINFKSYFIIMYHLRLPRFPKHLTVRQREQTQSFSRLAPTTPVYYHLKHSLHS